jgi:hypothetical protein
MNLTAGTALQGNKYMIQTLLNQTDLGATYEATHVYLDQSVILQTLNETVQQRSDFAQLQQDFKAGVRRVAKRLHPDMPRVLDYFEESGFPFVVLDYQPDQPIPKLSDWLSLPVEPPTQTVPITALEPQLEPEVPFLAQQNLAQQNGAIAPDSSPSSSGAVSSEITLPPEPASPDHDADTLTFSDVASYAVPAGLVAEEPLSHTSQPKAMPVHSRSRSKSKRWLPAALIVTSLAGGFVGAGIGFALRFSPSPATTTASDGNSGNASGKPSGLGNGLFSKEQDFPPDKDWPIQATAEFSPQPTLEQPIYRHTPPINYGAPAEVVQPLPANPVPVEPSPSPSPDQATGTIGILEKPSAPSTKSELELPDSLAPLPDTTSLNGGTPPNLNLSSPAAPAPSSAPPAPPAPVVAPPASNAPPPLPAPANPAVVNQ